MIYELWLAAMLAIVHSNFYCSSLEGMADVDLLSSFGLKVGGFWIVGLHIER